MSLQTDIQELQTNFLSQVPEDTIALIERTTLELVDSGIALKALQTGDILPAFSLPDAFGKQITSEALLSQGPLVINFYRGGWCPYCNLELKSYQEVLPDIHEFGAQLVAISPNMPDNSLSSMEKHKLEFPVLSDVGNTVARQFGLVFSLHEDLRPFYLNMGIDIPTFNGDDSFELPIPATYVVDTDGRIMLHFVDANYANRLEPALVLDCLAETKGREEMIL